MKKAEKAKKEAVDTLKKSIRAWNRIRRTALASQDAATAARAMTQCDELTRQLAELSAPADLPDQSQGLVDRLRQAYGLGPSKQSYVRVVYDRDDAPESLLQRLHAVAIACCDTRPAVAAAATRLASLITERPLGEELEREIERIEKEGDADEKSTAPVVDEGKASGETGIELARERANAGEPEPETEGVDDRAGGRAGNCAEPGFRGERSDPPANGAEG